MAADKAHHVRRLIEADAAIGPPSIIAISCPAVYSSYRRTVCQQPPALGGSFRLPKEVCVSAPAAAINGTNERVHKPIPVFENSPTFRMACRQLEMVAAHLDLDPGILERLSKPKRAMVVSIPIRM